jgi:hypothetical protein
MHTHSVAEVRPLDGPPIILHTLTVSGHRIYALNSNYVPASSHNKSVFHFQKEQGGGMPNWQ